MGRHIGLRKLPWKIWRFFCFIKLVLGWCLDQGCDYQLPHPLPLKLTRKRRLRLVDKFKIMSQCTEIYIAITWHFALLINVISVKSYQLVFADTDYTAFSMATARSWLIMLKGVQLFCMCRCFIKCGSRCRRSWRKTRIASRDRLVHWCVYLKPTGTSCHRRNFIHVVWVVIFFFFS